MIEIIAKKQIFLYWSLFSKTCSRISTTMKRKSVQLYRHYENKPWSFQLQFPSKIWKKRHDLKSSPIILKPSQIVSTVKNISVKNIKLNKTFFGFTLKNTPFCEAWFCLQIDVHDFRFFFVNWSNKKNVSFL